MQKFIRILSAAALIALAIWGWRVLFPSPENAIRARLKSLAKVVSFGPSDGSISKGYSAQKLTDYFTPQVDISLNAPGYPPLSITDRQELIQGLLYAQANLGSLKVEFLDINVTLGPDKESATANLTAKVTIGKSADFNVQELDITLKKVENRWIIYRVVTVKTLSLNARPQFTMLAHS